MINIPKGTKDVLPKDSYKWQYIEENLRKISRLFCIDEIRTPTFEHTELFLRGVGETTDIVNKEMYTFIDKGDRSITLKPEGTAGVARSFIENSLYADTQPTKMFYITPVFRYEKPQNGRLREHHQFGIEYYGSDSPYADAEVISVAKKVFDSFGVKELVLHINNIGCPECRKRYNEALKDYLRCHLDEMCATCRERFEKNPLRILDCKEEKCKLITANAPITLDYLCDGCREHHDTLIKILDSLGIDYVVDPKIVRGLDYYTGMVFEFVSNNIGAQGTVCGGGRYNDLVSEVGGKAMPAVGFGMGIERLMLTLENLGLPIGEKNKPSVYVAPISDNARDVYMPFVAKLRDMGISVESDIMARSVKAQMKFANKIEARYVVIIGDDELTSGVVNVKDMSSGFSEEVALSKLTEYFGGKI